MTIHEFGTENKKTVVLIHPSAVMWDYFEYIIPPLEQEYHLIIPALPGYDEEAPGDFTSVEEVAEELAVWLTENGFSDIALLYGCSMGGSVVIRMLTDNKIHIKNAVIDGGITPYQLPRILTFFIAVRDFLMVSAGKFGGIKLLEKAFSTDEYSDEDLKYVEKVLKFMNYKTIWRTFDSCNNYKMSKSVPQPEGRVEYWFADAEERARARDIQYMKKTFPAAELVKVDHVGHGGLASTQPERFAEMLVGILKENSEQNEG